MLHLESALVKYGDLIWSIDDIRHDAELILHGDIGQGYKRLKNNRGQPCDKNRGWHGLKGACERLKKGGDTEAAGKKSRQNLAKKIRKEKGFGVRVESKEARFERLSNTLKGSPSQSEFLKWKQEIAAMPEAERREYEQYRSLSKKATRKESSKKIRQLTTRRKSEESAYMNASPENRAILAFKARQEDYKRAFQSFGADVADSTFKDLKSEGERVFAASKLRNMADRPGIGDETYNSKQPKTLNLESGADPTSGARTRGVPWKVRSGVGAGDTDYVIGAARVEATQYAGRRQIRLTTSEDILNGRLEGGLTVEYKSSAENNARARRMVREISEGRARHSTIEEIAAAIDGSSIPGYRASVPPEAYGKNYSRLL